MMQMQLTISKNKKSADCLFVKESTGGKGTLNGHRVEIHCLMLKFRIYIMNFKQMERRKILLK